MISTPALLVSGHFNGPQTHKPCMETWNMAAETKIMKTSSLIPLKLMTHRVYANLILSLLYTAGQICYEKWKYIMG